jgi:hypothetical protein
LSFSKYIGIGTRGWYRKHVVILGKGLEVEIPTNIEHLAWRERNSLNSAVRHLPAFRGGGTVLEIIMIYLKELL